MSDAETRDFSALLRRDPCAYCGKDTAVVIDHIVPRIDDGPDHWSNMTAACADCNSKKRRRSLLFFLAGKKPPKKPAVQTTVYWRPALLAQLRESARRNNRSLNREIEYAAQRYLEQQKEQQS